MDSPHPPDFVAPGPHNRGEAPDDLPNTLVPLALAARLVLIEAYGLAFLGARTRTEEKLNAVAKALSALVPIFEYAGSSALGAEPIPSSELACGRFKRGAKEFHSDQGRRGPHFLAVRATDAQYALKVLKEASY
jgi:hypothetical protein